MTTHSTEEQLTKYLTDAHSIEMQALAQLERAPEIAGDDTLAAVFAAHLSETKEHERRVRECLEEREAEPSTVKDVAGRVGGWAMIVFARLNPDTPGKLVAHAFSYEHMELAAYELLARAAERAGDQKVLEAARAIGDEEQAMAGALAANFDHAVEASLREKGATDGRSELISYLRDAHAIEAQAIQLLESGARIAQCEVLADAFHAHLQETREHQRTVDARLEAMDVGPSRLQAAALRMGGLNIGAFFGAQPDTPVKLAGFAFAFEHLEIAAYELLRRVAEHAHDSSTVELCERILPEEHAAAKKIAATWDAVIDTALDGVSAAA